MKLRLHGTQAEVAEATRRLLEVVAASPPYPDRASVLVRVYLVVYIDPTGPTNPAPAGPARPARRSRSPQP